MIDPLRSKLRSITDLIPDVKGPIDKDRRLLTPAGVAIMQGLIAGIDSQRSNLRSTLNGVTGMVAGASLGGLRAPGAGVARMAAMAGSSSTSTVNNYTLNANMAASYANVEEQFARMSRLAPYPV